MINQQPACGTSGMAGVAVAAAVSDWAAVVGVGVAEAVTTVADPELVARLAGEHS